MMLSAERAAEEARGQVRWLRPEQQTPAALPGTPPDETKAEEGEETPAPVKTPPKRQKKRAAGLLWPAGMPERIGALLKLLRGEAEPMPTAQISAAFQGASLEDVEMTLPCVAAADAVVKTETESGDAAWVTRA